MDIIKVFGTNVRKYRTQKKVSQEKFAEICGLHRTYISDVECFRRSISLDNIQKIADALSQPGSQIAQCVHRRTGCAVFDLGQHIAGDLIAAKLPLR